ncbi:winged helix-turn-helix transcriptional regulator [Plantactinospora sp. CA-290183]|uniref:winged helix-turn-helix transcriptional regulator n=1 Tax=Plantactinospora sp. CA-290183 TaxID=3240006 RepID=UPI003D922F1E
MRDFSTAYIAFRICGYRWTLEILTALESEPMRFTDLLQTIQPRPSPKSLHEALQRLQVEQLVGRAKDRGRYQLSSAGRQLLPLLGAFIHDLDQWDAAHRNAPTTPG